MYYNVVLTKSFINIGFRLWASPGPRWGTPSPAGSSTSQFVRVRNWPQVYVNILDQLKDKFHLGLIGLDWDIFVDSLDAPEALRLEVDRVEPIDAGGEAHIVSAVCVTVVTTVVVGGQNWLPGIWTT